MFKIHGHKHAFEASTLTERDGWFVAVESAIVEAKEAKEGIESSEAYKEEKTKLGKFDEWLRVDASCRRQRSLDDP